MLDEELKRYLAELIGTFALVFIGCGSAVIAGQYIGFLGISLAFGLTLMAMIYVIGSISGCHINPAVTIAMFFADKIKPREALGYILFQCFGAIIGAGLLLAIASGLPGYSIAEDGLGQNGYDEQSPAGYSLSAGLIAEVVLTALFLIVIFAATSEKAPKNLAGFSIGLTLAFIHMVGIPITGTSVNPARSLGPALFMGGDAIVQLWLFWLAPIMGGMIATAIWKLVLEE